MPFFAILFTLLLTFSSNAQEQLPTLPALGVPEVNTEAAVDLTFARKLEREGSLYAALLEWRRIVYLASDQDTKEEAMFRVAKINLGIGYHREALNAFERFGSQFPHSNRIPEALYLMGDAARKLDPRGADLFTGRLQDLFPNNPWTKAAEYRDFWLAIQRGESNFPPTQNAQIEELKHRLTTEGVPNAKAEAWLATALSVLPGLGHLYLADWRTALMALLFNGLFLFATYYAIRQKHWPYAAIWGVIFLILYSGTFFSAHSLAHRNVHELRLELLQSWPDLRPTIPSSVDEDAVPVAFHPLQSPLWVYRNVIGTFDGDRGNGSPVNSFYAQQAIDKHGMLIGTWMTVDRLLRDWREIAQPTLQIRDGDKVRYVDPLTRNDFWLNS